MKITKERIEFTKRIITSYIVVELAKGYNITTEEAYRRFMGTKTYELLQSNSSKLYVESQEYVLDMLLSEINNDIARWMEI